MVGKTAVEKIKDSYKIKGQGKAIGTAFDNFKTQFIKVLEGFASETNWISGVKTFLGDWIPTCFLFFIRDW